MTSFSSTVERGNTASHSCSCISVNKNKIRFLTTKDATYQHPRRDLRRPKTTPSRRDSETPDDASHERATPRETRYQKREKNLFPACFSRFLMFSHDFVRFRTFSADLPEKKTCMYMYKDLEGKWEGGVLGGRHHLLDDKNMYFCTKKHAFLYRNKYFCLKRYTFLYENKHFCIKKKYTFLNKNKYFCLKKYTF